jgi:hypothetical protein
MDRASFDSLIIEFFSLESCLLVSQTVYASRRFLSVWQQQDVMPLYEFAADRAPQYAPVAVVAAFAAKLLKPVRLLLCLLWDFAATGGPHSRETSTGVRLLWREFLRTLPTDKQFEALRPATSPQPLS